MDAHVGLSGRTGRRALLALLAVVSVWMVVGASQANASVSLVPSTVGSGIIVTDSVANGSPSYGGCFNTGFRDDRVAFGCPGADLVGATTCVLFFCGFPVDSSLVLVAIPNGAPAGHWSFVRWEGCDAVFGTLCTIVNPATVNNVRFPRAVFNDSVGPAVSALSAAYSTGTDRGVSFTGVTGNETLAAVNCSVDGGAMAPCSNVRQFPEGTHTVRAQGTDLSGNVGAVSGNLASFRILDTTLVNGPANFSTDKKPTFTYSTISGINFECRLYNQGSPAPAFTACGTKNPAGQASFTPTTDLTDGVKIFEVKATDGPEFDRVPLTRTWTVDTTAPVISALNSPTITEGVVTTALDATFTWAVTEVGALDHFECTLDGGAPEPCASGKTYSDLPFGSRTFAVRGVDKAGNAGPEVKRTWRIDAKDGDGDGFSEPNDCNDNNAARTPRDRLPRTASTRTATASMRSTSIVTPTGSASRRLQRRQPEHQAGRHGHPRERGRRELRRLGRHEAAAAAGAATVSFNFPSPGRIHEVHGVPRKTVPAARRSWRPARARRAARSRRSRPSRTPRAP